MSASTKKPRPKLDANDTLLESLRDMGRGVAKTVKTDLVGGMASDALASLFGTPQSGQMTPGEEVPLNHPPASEPEQPRSGFGYREHYFSQYSQETIARLRQQEQEVAQKIEEIRLELKALMVALRSVDREIQQATNEQLVDPGQYHLNFLDRLKVILKLLRQNLQDSNSWLIVMRSRKKERRYWAMFKKKGTEWGLNPDRVVATQVG